MWVKKRDQTKDRNNFELQASAIYAPIRSGSECKRRLKRYRLPEHRKYQEDAPLRSSSTSVPPGRDDVERQVVWRSSD